MLKKRIGKILSLILIASVSFSLTACGSNSDDEEQVVQNERYEYLNGLADGGYYILHADNTVEGLVFPYATFERNNTGGPSNSRMFIMNRDDYSSIPTLYEGDRLIYYYTGVLTESFWYERFEDLGYSIGLAGMGITNSGRYSIPTTEGIFYPDGDTSLLTNFANEIVLMETLGGIPLRAVRSDEGSFMFESNSVSRCGSILGLTEGDTYKAEIYAGTRLYNYSFTADKRFFASMETTSTINFSFENDTIACIEIPEYFNSGYYTINGYGLFRYVKGKTYNENDNFNEPNIPDTSTGNIDSSINDISTGESFSAQDTEAYATRNINVKEKGTYKVTLDIEFEDATASGFDGLLETTARIINPSETRKWVFDTTENGDLSVTFEATETGAYNIYIDNMDYRTVKVDFEKL